MESSSQSKGIDEQSQQQQNEQQNEQQKDQKSELKLELKKDVSNQQQVVFQQLQKQDQQLPLINEKKSEKVQVLGGGGEQKNGKSEQIKTQARQSRSLNTAINRQTFQGSPIKKLPPIQQKNNKETNNKQKGANQYNKTQQIPRKLAIDKQQTIFIGPGNNSNLIKGYFEKRNWKILDQQSKFKTQFDMKWVQTIMEVDWSFFNENNQMVNHIQNILIWATKNGLLQTIKEYENKDNQLQYTNPNSSNTLPQNNGKENQQMVKSSNGNNQSQNQNQLVQNQNQVTNINNNGGSQTFNSSKFIPQTYRLDILKEDLSYEEQQFMNTRNEGLWIFKPTHLNCGKGIKIIQDIKKFKEDFQKMKNNSQSIKTGKNFVSDYFSSISKRSIIQKYISQPLLLEKRKFDLRMYVLIACTKPLYVLYHPGYVRLSIQDYSLNVAQDGSDMCTHLTNAFVQKKHPSYDALKESTIWSMNKFEQYCMKNYDKSDSEIQKLNHQMKQILCYTIKCGQKKIERKQGTFELLGCDILIDQNFNPYLLEINYNPALWTDTNTQAQIIPEVVIQGLDIILNINQQRKSPQVIISNDQNIDLGNYEVLINEATNYYYV